MSPRCAVVATAAVFAQGCGGVVRDDLAPPSIDGGSMADDAAGLDAATKPGPCRTSDGLRLCGGSCPDLGRTECPGVGCQPFVDRVSGQALGMGVCVADLPVPLEQCGRCRDGDVCAHIAGEGAVCVSERLCQDLHARGLAAACRYADFAPYDGAPLAVARGSDCPRWACGPGCSTCDAFATGRCTGRSARHGYGFCFVGAWGPACNPTAALSADCVGACIAWTPSDPTDTTSLAYGLCDSPYDECSAGDGRLTCRTP